MSSDKKYLVVIDPTAEEHPVLERAGWLAEKTGAAMELFICYYDQYISGERFFDTNHLKKAREEVINNQIKTLEKLARPLRERGLEVFTDAVWDNPIDDAVVRKAIKARPDLVLKDTHYHSKAHRAFFTNTDWGLIRNCPSPLCLVKPHSWPKSAVILASVDPLHEHDKPADLDRRILGTANELAADCGAELHVFHAYDPISIVSATAAAPEPMTLPVDEIQAELEQTHAGRLREVVEPFNVSAERIHLESGRVRDRLPETVERINAGLVVMGAVSRGRLKRVFVGSTAERVMDTLPCDLLVIKPDWFESDT